jgi:hypothetical protein
MIKRRAGRLPVPVGYPATLPAVLLQDVSGISPSESGVIGFLDRRGVPVKIIRSDSPDATILATIKELQQ